MEDPKKKVSESDEVAVLPGDILFECPSCAKGLVVDESAEGLIVECPKCHINVIVPPRTPKTPVATPPTPAATPKGGGVEGVSSDRLNTLSNQLKEIQAQRTEITNRIASRLNEVNRDLVMLARLETSQQQIVGEWNQLTAAVAKPAKEQESKKAPAVVGSSVTAGRSRVSFRG